MKIFGHFPVTNGDNVSFYCHMIYVINLLSEVGVNRWTAYKCVRSIYDKFIPEHLSRIRSAVALLPDPALKQPSTGLGSQAATEMPASTSSIKMDKLAQRMQETATEHSREKEQLRQQMQETATEHSREKEQLRRETAETVSVNERLTAQLDKLVQQMQETATEHSREKEQLRREMQKTATEHSRETEQLKERLEQERRTLEKEANRKHEEMMGLMKSLVPQKDGTT